MRHAQKQAKGIISQIDESVWDNVALKKLSTMPKQHLSIQTNQIINDATNMAWQVPQSPDSITLPPKIFTEVIPKQTAIPYMRTSKWSNTIEDPASSFVDYESVISQRRSKEQKTVRDTNWQSTISPLQETFPDENEHQLRVQKHKTDEYNQEMQEKEVRYKKRRQYKSLMARQRFREMKSYTFDYEGKAVSSKSYSEDSPSKVFNLSSEYGQRRIMKILDRKEPPKPKKVTQKKTVGGEEETMVGAMMRRIEQGRAEEFKEKVNQLLKEQRLSGTFNSMPNSSNIQMGVSVTNLTQHSKVKGKPRNPTDIRSMTLNQFKVTLPRKGTPSVSFYGGNRPDSAFIVESQQKLKGSDQNPEPPYKTEYVSKNETQIDCSKRRIKTEHSQRGDSAWNQLKRRRKYRGSIQITNSKLYSEHFSAKAKGFNG